MVKQNLPNLASSTVTPDNLIGEMTKYQELYAKMNRSTIGVGSFTSTTSGITYSTNSYSSDPTVYDKGEDGLLNLLAKYILKDYLITANDINSLTPITGSGTFNSTIGVTIEHNIGHTIYKVAITPTSNANGYLGEVYVEKNENNIIVYCTGSTTITPFDYIIYQ